MKWPFIVLVLTSASPLLSKEWWDAPSGSAETGPGQGLGGILTNDVSVTASQKLLEASEKIMAEMAEEKKRLEEAQKKEMQEIEEAIGKPSDGIQVEEYKYKPDVLTLIQRNRLLEELEASEDAQNNQAFIQYLKTQQQHEARFELYAQRLNALIKANNSKLNLAQRVKLGAELELFGGQMALAEQERREAANRMKIAGSESRKNAAEKEAQRRGVRREVQTMTIVP